MSLLDEINNTIAALETALSNVAGIRINRVDGEEQVQQGLQSLPAVFVAAASENPREPVRVGSPSQGLVRSIEVLVGGRDPKYSSSGADLYTVLELVDAALLGFRIRGASSSAQLQKGPARRVQILTQGQLWQRSWTYWIPGSEV